MACFKLILVVLCLWTWTATSIFKGKDATYEDNSHLIRIISRKDGHVTCSASFAQDGKDVPKQLDRALTSAHCFCRPEKINSLVFAEFPLRTRYGAPMKLDINKVECHPQYVKKPGCHLHPNDIAIIYFNESIEMNNGGPKIVPLEISTRPAMSYKGNKCKFAGAGASRIEKLKNGELKPVGDGNLKEMEMEVVSPAGITGKDGKVIEEKSFVAKGTKEKESPMAGDSGGPIICQDGTKRYLVGFLKCGLSPDELEKKKYQEWKSYFADASQYQAFWKTVLKMP